MAPAKACPFTKASADFDPFDLTDPFPFHALARKQEPVFFSDRLGYWVVTCHADIKAVFDTWQVFSSENAQEADHPRRGGKCVSLARMIAPGARASAAAASG